MMTVEEAKAVIYGNVVYACEKAGFSPHTVKLVQDACDTIIDLADRKTEPTISKMEQVETMSCQECKRWIYDDRWGWFCPLKCQDECKYEPKDLEQFRVDLEYHTDTTHFGKAKGESITTNKVEDEPQTDCAWK